MPFYSDEQIEEVRTANDIVDVISAYVSLKKKGGQYVGLCPFHNEKTPSFPYPRASRCTIALAAAQGGMCLLS